MRLECQYTDVTVESTLPLRQTNDHYIEAKKGEAKMKEDLFPHAQIYIIEQLNTQNITDSS